jgi:Zn-dependent M28 family amino/carboxypeptidase
MISAPAENWDNTGSAYFAEQPTVPLQNIVASINLDMFLPLHPLKVLRGYGLNESDLSLHLEAAARENGLSVQDDPTPEQNYFVRSDQYSFILKGIPSLYLTFGYAPNTPEEATVMQFLRERYHGPSDDTKQPVDRRAAVQFNRLMASLARRIADASQRPRWKQGSFFQRFTK